VAFKQMLRVAPTNQKLREELFKYFLQSGHPETALEVADEGLKLDPYNADLYDLKSNACLFLSDSSARSTRWRRSTPPTARRRTRCSSPRSQPPPRSLPCRIR